MNPLSLFFAKYKALAIGIALVVMCFASYRVGVKLERAEWQQKEVERKQAENAAILHRIKENERKAEQDKLNSARIAKEHKNAMDKVRSDIAAERLRKPAWCDRPTEGTEADRPNSSNAHDPGGRLLPPAVEQDIRRLVEETEWVVAIGRACQEFVRSNGMAPE